MQDLLRSSANASEASEGEPVVKDGFSDSDERAAAVADHLDRNSNDQLLSSPVGNLTQELGQLLAALIAQNRANKGGAQTNAELTSLANLVSAAAARRTIAPASKEDGHDDEAMPIPSTWRQPLARDDDRWFHQQMCAAVLGLIAGLMIVVPAVLWLSGFFSPQRSETAAARAVPTAVDVRTAPEAKLADLKTVPADPVRTADQSPESEAQLVKGNVEQPSPAPVDAEPPPLVAIIATARLIGPNQARIDGLLSQAGERIESGDVAGAREMLAGADDGVQGAVSFALAETYDPNMLAAWGARGGDADAAKARALYQKAFGLGVARAQNRLDALRP
jgi:hypothetical protein